MIVGVDFDNTIVSYDALFPQAAAERGFELPADARTKHGVREFLREREDGELEWRRLQAVVYGARIADAEMIAGVDRFFRTCRARGIPTYIVSHKTEVTHYIDPPINLRVAALDWMTAHKFFGCDGFALDRDAVHFSATRRAKIEKIAALGCTHFIDDLEDVLLDTSFPSTIERLLFSPAKPSPAASSVTAFSSWDGICDHLFGAAR